jgi:hypothetical protein
MMVGEGPLDEIRAKIALLRRVEAEHGFGVVIEEQTETLEPVPDLPAGVVEVFSIFRRLGGSCFRFVQPPEISSATAFADRDLDGFYDLLGHPLVIGYAVGAMHPEMVAEADTGPPIYLDIQDGSVYHIDTDEYIYYVKGAWEDEIEGMAPDIVTFFNDCVLGAGYRSLAQAVPGVGAADHRVRKGRHKGQYTDSWRRLLVAAGLDS